MNQEKFCESKNISEIPKSIELNELISILSDAKIPLAPWSNVEESQSYPGLSTYHNKYPFTAKIGVEEFSQNGYIEEQSDKTNYFVWDIVDGYNPPNLKR